VSNKKLNYKFDTMKREEPFDYAAFEKEAMEKLKAGTPLTGAGVFLHP
jgi:hypothetical protein